MKIYLKKYISKFGLSDVIFLAAGVLCIYILYPTVWGVVGVICIILLDLLYKTFLVDDDEINQ